MPLPGLMVGSKPLRRGAARAPAAPVDPELRDLTRRFRVAVRLTLLVVLAAMGDRYSSDALAFLPPRLWVWLQLVLSLPIVLWSAAPLFGEALGAFARGRASRSTPVVLAVAALWIWSLAGTIRPDLFYLAYLDESFSPILYFRHATVIVTLVLVARVLEARARVRPAATIEALGGLMPRSARRLGADGREEDAAVGVLAPGDSVRVWVGDSMPADGVVVEGQSAIDESKIAGAPEPRAVGPGDLVLAGAANREGGPLVVRVEREAGDRLLSRLVRTLKSALASRASMEGVAERFGARVIGVGLLVAAATFVYWTWRGPEPMYSLGLLTATAVLVVLAPGAFALAARSSIAGAIVRGARSGVVLRDAAAIEKLRDADTLLALVTRPLAEGEVDALRELRASGLRVVLWMVEGVTVPALPDTLGVDVVPAPSSAEEAGAALAALHAEKRVVATAVAADRAEGFPSGDVGIVLLSGFEDASADAGVILVRGDLRSVLRARRLARAAVANQKQGVLLVFAYTALAVPVAAGALFPYLGVLLDPMLAAAAAAWCTVMVLASTLRLRWEEL